MCALLSIARKGGADRDVGLERGEGFVQAAMAHGARPVPPAAQLWALDGSLKARLGAGRRLPFALPACMGEGGDHPQAPPGAPTEGDHLGTNFILSPKAGVVTASLRLRPVGLGLNAAAFVCMPVCVCMCVCVCVCVCVCGQHEAGWLGCLALHSNEARAAAMCWTASLPWGRMVGVCWGVPGCKFPRTGSL